jgi:hypothetical protein
VSRASYIVREFRCLRCSTDEQLVVLRDLPWDDPKRHGASFRARFWTASEFRGHPLTPTLRDVHCPYCGANASWFEPYPKPGGVQFLLPLRDDLRPVVFRWHDAKGREHIRYPARNDADARPGEEVIDFPTLRSMERFLKEENPNYRDWQVPLNDILDYDEAHLDAVACDDFDPEARELAEAMELVDDAGVLDAPPDPSDVRMSLVDSLGSGSGSESEAIDD